MIRAILLAIVLVATSLVAAPSVSAVWGPGCADGKNLAVKFWKDWPAAGATEYECGHTSYAVTTEGSLADANFGNSAYEGSIDNFNDIASTVKFWNNSSIDICLKLQEDQNYFGGRQMEIYLDSFDNTTNINLHAYGAGDAITSVYIDKTVAGPSDCNDTNW